MIRWIFVSVFILVAGATARAEFGAAEKAYSDGDIDLAIQEFEKRAIEGSGDALFTLGVIYARGVDVDRDLVAAYKWLCLAAQTGTESAGRRARSIARPLSHEQIRKADQSAKQWLEEHPQGVEFQTCYDSG